MTRIKFVVTACSLFGMLFLFVSPGWSMFKTIEYISIGDSIKLATDVYLPDSIGQFPCILYLTPYGRENIKKEPEKFIEKGYAVVCQDIRGKFGSNGTFYPFKNDRSDGSKTIEWIREQSWSNGKICGWGGSYLGYTQWAVADQLDMISPIFTTANMYDALYPDGLMSLGLAFRWGLLVDSKTVNAISPEKMEQSYYYLPLSAADDSTLKNNPFTDDWLSHEYYDTYWGKIDHRGEYSMPVFAAAGWYDIFLMPQIMDFIALGSRRNSDSYLFIGPWAHGSFAAKVEFGDNADYGKVVAPVLNRLVDKYMLNRKVDIIQPPFEEKPFHAFIMQRNEWYSFNQWPPIDVEFSNLNFGDNNSFLLESNAGGKYTWNYDPSDPYPSLGGTIIGTDVGPAWQNNNIERKDQLAFVTNPVDSALILLGPINAELFVKTDVPSTDIVVCLQDVFPDGKILNIQEGGARIFSDPKAPETRKVDISLWATGYQINPKHQIRVVVTSSWFPRFNRNLNSGEPLFKATNILKSTQTLFYGKDTPSRIILPVLDLE